MTLDQFKAYLNTIPVDQRVDVSERAAIMQHDGGLTEEVAMEQAVKAHKEGRR